MSWLGWLNFLLVQWTCFRIAIDRANGDLFLLGPVVPMTGWFGLPSVPRRPRTRRLA